jgi:hypothetical protein
VFRESAGRRAPHGKLGQRPDSRYIRLSWATLARFVSCELDSQECAAACCGPRCASRTLRAAPPTSPQAHSKTARGGIRVPSLCLHCSNRWGEGREKEARVAGKQRQRRVGVPNRRHLAKAHLRASLRQHTTTTPKNALTEPPFGAACLRSRGPQTGEAPSLRSQTVMRGAWSVCGAHRGPPHAAAHSRLSNSQDAKARQGCPRPSIYRRIWQLSQFPGRSAPARAHPRQIATPSKDPMCIARDPRAEHP